MTLWTVLTGIIAGVLFGGLAYAAGSLTRVGAIVGGGFGACLIVLGGPAWVVPGVVFFGTSSVLSRVGRQQKSRSAHRVEKGGTRDAVQVLANGSVAWGMLLVSVGTGPDVSLLAFVAGIGAIATATADTWATELGTLASGTPRSITTLRLVPPGTSGGVSVLGTVSGLMGGAVIAISVLIPLALGTNTSTHVSAWADNWEVGLLSWILGGGVGMFADSLLGATVQARYRDPVSGDWTERRPNPSAEPDRGISGITNDVVNGLGTAVGAVCSALLYVFGLSL